MTLRKAVGDSGSSYKKSQSSDAAEQEARLAQGFDARCRSPGPTYYVGGVAEGLILIQNGVSRRSCDCDTCTSFSFDRAIGCKRGSGDVDRVQAHCSKPEENLDVWHLKPRPSNVEASFGGCHWEIAKIKVGIVSTWTAPSQVEWLQLARLFFPFGLAGDLLPRSCLPFPSRRVELWPRTRSQAHEHRTDKATFSQIWTFSINPAPATTKEYPSSSLQDPPAAVIFVGRRQVVSRLVGLASSLLRFGLPLLVFWA